jgi:hypothetical protein
LRRCGFGGSVGLIQRALNAVVAYCGKVGDAVVMSAATETGKLVARTAYVATLDHIANNGRLVRFVKDLLAFGGG